ncbi:MAG: hypothetical protein CMJ85_05505 [Planctomycetes bacterium]|jgi:hypothetical protein|nr:hypothetical protein [Planctomycetota bacterium]
MRLCIYVVVALASSLSARGASQQAGTPKPTVAFDKLDGRVRVRIGEKLFTDYVYKKGRFPYMWPIIGAKGRRMTRDFPMRKGVDGETDDHPHHRSMWFTHGSVNGHEFWSGKGRIVQTTMALFEKRALLVTRNDWLGSDGKVVCTDERQIVFGETEVGRFIGFTVTLHATSGDVVFGDTKEGSMALRLHPRLRLRGKRAAGEILNSEGVRDKQCWGKRARWVDYWGPIEDQVVGVAIFDHPKNHGYPCRWHARDYGLAAANPWGVSQFERKPKGTGDMTLAKGKKLTLRYRFVFHAGGPKRAGIEAEWQRFARDEPPAKGK